MPDIERLYCKLCRAYVNDKATHLKDMHRLLAFSEGGIEIFEVRHQKVRSASIERG
jgi:hypothetical protein